MGCCGKHLARTANGLPDIARNVLPTDECVLCAEKHFSTAYALAQESGYGTPNRQRIVGELVLAQWHSWHTDLKLAESIRAIRHLIQQRREAEVEWAGMLAEIDALATEESKKNET